MDPCLLSLKLQKFALGLLDGLFWFVDVIIQAYLVSLVSLNEAEDPISDPYSAA